MVRKVSLFNVVNLVNPIIPLGGLISVYLEEVYNPEENKVSSI